MNVITADDLRLMYQGMSKAYRNNNVLRDVAEWLKPRNYKIFATFRPKKTKINSVNAFDLFIKPLYKFDCISSLFYTIEKDRYGKSNHAHLLIAGDVTKQQFAGAMNRNATTELPYWEQVQNSDSVLIYTSKRQNKGDLLQGWGEISQQDVDKQIDINCGIIDHPNKKYHDRAALISNKVYGWKKYHIAGINS